VARGSTRNIPAVSASGTVELGYEIGTGHLVAIPIAHTVVTGQSQAAGKTTTLEALVARSNVQAVAFVTKRGEGAFTGGHRISPYFRERADWRFVESIIESAMRQKMRFERAWIVRASKHAKSLADVRRNVQKLQEKSTRGMDADIYMLLGEYLDLVVPLIEKLPTVTRLNLRKGLNVMDLGPYPTELQMLVIQSVLEWVYENEQDTVVVIPEAWEFVPQTRGSPVKLAATSLVRKGANLHNFVWLDSQDIAGVEKEILRQAPVWLLGVQREANEIKRTLEHIPAGIKKPKAADIATLERGQFFACWGSHAVKTYVRPAWLSADAAREVATGFNPNELARAAALGRSAGVRLQEIMSGAPVPTLKDSRYPALTEDDRARSIEIETKEEDEEMKPEDMKQLATMIGEAVGDRVDHYADVVRDQVDRLIAVDKKGRPAPPTVMGPQKTVRMLEGGEKVAEAEASHGLEVGAEESLYQRFVARLRKEAPGMIRLLAEEPLIEIEIERPVLQLDATTLRGRISRLVAEAFFREVRDGSAILAELARRGGGMGDRANYARELGWLTEKGFLTREDGGWLATKGKVKVTEK
jgi:hypothetical protein